MENATEKKGFRAFLAKKNVTLSPKLYFVKTMGMMAMGLFASLLMGTIFQTIFTFTTDVAYKLYVVGSGSFISDLFYQLSSFSSQATGAVLGISVAYALEAPPLVLFSAGAVGLAGNALGAVVDGKSVAAGPLGAFLCVLVAVELGKLVSKETKVDILVTPVVTIGSGILLARVLCAGVAYVVYYLGSFVNTATETAPFIMGILVSVTVGVILTLPISSAAICAMIGISGLAGGAATAGCCAQMIGFAVISFRENRFGGLVAQGLGTSMLQMGNIVKKPVIWVPATLAAAITGPIATCLFKLQCTGVSAGMGTCGLVGPIGIFTDMGFTTQSIIGVILVCIVLPAALSLAFSEGMRKLGWIKDGDMKLDL